MAFLQSAANRGSVSTGGYEIDNSCKFEADNTEKIQSAESDAGNRKTWTFSIWCKRTELGSGNFALWTHGDSFIGFEADKLMVSLQYSGSSDFRFKTSRLFRDTSAFYHIVVAVDTTQGTDTNRLKIYVNGVQETSFSSTGAGYPSQNFDTGFVIGGDTDHPIGNSAGGNAGFCGYLSEILFIDTLQKAPTDFGEFDDDSGIWIPKNYSGAFAGRSFWYEFKNSGSMGADSSGNSHTGLLNNIAAKDQATDSPTNIFCTLNPLVNFKYTTNGIFEGGTQYGNSTGGGVGGAFGTMAVTSGKWYWEVKLIQQVAHYIGVSAVDDGDNVLASTDPQEINSTFRFNISAARREYVNNGTQTYGSLDEFSDFHTAGDIIGIALNMDDNQISIYGNGTLQTGVANTSLFDASNKMVVPFHGTINDQVQYNFGGYSAYTESSPVSDENGYGTFEYAPPSGYYALCTKNLAEYG